MDSLLILYYAAIFIGILSLSYSYLWYIEHKESKNEPIGVILGSLAAILYGVIGLIQLQNTEPPINISEDIKGPIIEIISEINHARESELDKKNLDNLTNNNFLYESKVSLKKGQIYNDLKTNIRVKILDINESTGIINYIIDDSEKLKKKGSLVAKKGSNEVYFYKNKKRYKITLTNIRKIGWTNIVELNIIESI